MTPSEIRERLEYLRGEIEAEQISQGELIELQDLAEHIDPTDVVLLEWAGVPEFPTRYVVTNDVRLTLDVEAKSPAAAVRKARDTSLDEWQIGDKDEVFVYNEETGKDEDFDWTDVEASRG